jgi:hypothetical protein
LLARSAAVDESLVFSDDDISASEFSDTPRPGYDALVEVIRAGLVQAVCGQCS